MQSGLQTDVAFFGPLEANLLLKVDSLPGRIGGKPAWETWHTIGADAAIAAQRSAELGLEPMLVCNPVGDDPFGQKVIETLRQSGLSQLPESRSDRDTPLTVTFCFPDGAHSCLAYVAKDATDLLEVDLSPILSAKLLYVDVYPHLKAALHRVLAFASQHHVPLFLNFGLFCPLTLSEECQIVSAFDLDISALQISCDHVENANADDAYNAIRQFSPGVSLVTLGESGSIIRHEGEIAVIEANTIKSLYTCGSGAAYSAGFIAAFFFRKLTLVESGRFASAVAGLHCIHRGARPVTSADVAAMLAESIEPS